MHFSFFQVSVSESDSYSRTQHSHLWVPVTRITSKGNEDINLFVWWWWWGFSLLVQSKIRFPSNHDSFIGGASKWCKKPLYEILHFTCLYHFIYSMRFDVTSFSGVITVAVFNGRVCKWKKSQLLNLQWEIDSNNFMCQILDLLKQTMLNLCVEKRNIYQCYP